MTVTLLKALIALLPACMLLSGSAVLFSRTKAVSCFLQLLGTGGLVVVVLAHVCEALHLFPGMGWGLEASIGHYLDLGSALVGITAFPTGYLIYSLTTRRIDPSRAMPSRSARTSVASR